MPLDMMNDIRSMDAGGVPRAEIARRLGASRNTVAKYADVEDMSPAAPAPRRGRGPPSPGTRRGSSPCSSRTWGRRSRASGGVLTSMIICPTDCF